jgi:hypothetical protein
LNKTERWAFALVKRTAAGGPLPSPKVYILPAAVVTVSDPWRINRRKNIDSSQSKIASTHFLRSPHQTGQATLR